MTRITIRRHVSVHLVSTTDMYGNQVDLHDEGSDPHDVFVGKVEAVSELLDCSYEEAERLVLRKPGCSIY